MHPNLELQPVLKDSRISIHGVETKSFVFIMGSGHLALNGGIKFFDWACILETFARWRDARLADWLYE